MGRAYKCGLCWAQDSDGCRLGIGVQAEQSVRVAAEQALQASRDEVQALSAKARRAEKRRKRLQATMEGFTEAAQQPILTHGQYLIPQTTLTETGRIFTCM